MLRIMSQSLSDYSFRVDSRDEEACPPDKYHPNHDVADNLEPSYDAEDAEV